MKKILFMLLSVATVSVFGQGKTLYTVNVVKPKAGMRSAFEAGWKLHLDKFHKTDDKRMVYEVISGPNLGSYTIIEGPYAYADMDKEKSNAKEHGLDLEKNISPKQELGMMNFTYRLVDTLSRNGDVKADKFLVTITTVKDGKLGEYLAELRRGTMIGDKLNSPFSANVYVQQQAGSSPTVVTVRNLKNGFKEMEMNYFQLPPNSFRDAYVKEYGQEQWDKRLKLLVDDVVSRVQQFEKLRPDLSSK